MSQTILVVDDEMQIVRLLRGYLEQAGYRVLTAYNGVEALSIARQERPDLVSSTCSCPRWMGWNSPVVSAASGLKWPF